ncbi:MAG: transcription-repair coupling factor [Desulfomonile tiedjei]|nr:transcription-repair coupling factor [Desulfomonile tiedjei]
MTPSVPTSLNQGIDFLAHSTAAGGVYGLCGSAAAFVTAAAVKGGARTLVVVLTDGDAASQMATDVRFFLGETEAERRPLLERVIAYPSSDMLPFSFGGFEADVGAGRMTALFRLTQGKTPRVVTVSLDALIRRVVPRSVFHRASFTLAVGKELDREDLLQRLVAAGYSRSPLVEDSGEFSVRGFIIDVYPPLYPYPVRIEQMGDRIESIRFFDPANQRSREDVPEIEIGPIHMMIPDEAAKEQGIRRILQACEDIGVEKRVRQNLVDDLRHGVRFPGAENYLPYFFTDSETLFDYLPPDTTLILPDRDTLAHVFQDLEEEVWHGHQSAMEEGLPVPPAEQLYLSKHDLVRKAEPFRQVILSRLEVEEPNRVTIRIGCESNEDIRQDLLKSKGYDVGMGALVARLAAWRDEGEEVFLVSHTQGQAHRLMKLLEPYSLHLDFRGEGFEPSNLGMKPTPGLRVHVGPLSSGFRMPHAGTIFITEEEIFGSRVRTRPHRHARGTFISSLTDLGEGEAVVHGDYGIGIFRGLARKEFDGITGEVMVIEYAGGDLLYHPLDRLHVIQKYVAGSEEPPRIDRLGGKGWIKTKAKVKRSIREMAAELLSIYAKRQVARREPYSPADESFAAFEAAFEFEETPDQAKAIQDVMEAMDTDRPMDRLVCGDVGYGKTEVALRAAFRAMMDGKQVAVLVPTTVLAQQHYDTFTRRFRGYPFHVDMLSRFRSSIEQKEVLHKLTEGKLDLVIGTHKLLQKSVAFRDLGLLVIDEEQRFGVAHKERIKKYKAEVDALTLTATPIPRTLNLALSGIRDLSVIETPPANRQSIRTHVVRQSDEVTREALVREINRGGQAFYIHNRVQSIYRRAAALQKLVPEARFGVAHGQMGDTQLEGVMTDFVTGKINVLVCTNIVESGLDIPRANTIIIERADTFGLADLYQLRGRVGRSHVRAYAYLLTPPETMITPDAIKRLAVVQEYSDLGQGFRIAMRDMEIRGAGNLLGTSQSGHVAQVGYEMYLDLLEEAVREIKGEEPQARIDPEVHLRIEALIPEEYVPDSHQRMNLYKRLSRAADTAELDEVEEEIIDLYGKTPSQVSFLLAVMRIRIELKNLRILRLDYTGRELVFGFDAETPVSPEALIFWAQKNKMVRLVPGDKLAYCIGEVDPETRIRECFAIIGNLSKLIRPREAGALPAIQSG